ncbi:hypothetical protein [Novosphingobium lindaniclasticum]
MDRSWACIFGAMTAAIKTRDEFMESVSIRNGALNGFGLTAIDLARNFAVRQHWHGNAAESSAPAPKVQKNGPKA